MTKTVKYGPNFNNYDFIRKVQDQELIDKVGAYADYAPQQPEPVLPYPKQPAARFLEFKPLLPDEILRLPNNSIFIDAADNKVKIKDNNGNILTLQGDPGPPGPPAAIDFLQIYVTAQHMLNKAIPLGFTPLAPQKVVLDIQSLAPQFYGPDYTVVGSDLLWNALDLDGLIQQGDLVRIISF